MAYQAVPLAPLLEGLQFPADTVIEAVATDGFAAQLSVDLVVNTDPKERWRGSPSSLRMRRGRAPLPGKSGSAGWFYLVWTGHQASTVRSEQWPYPRWRAWSGSVANGALAAASPSIRPRRSSDPIRSGQSLFVTQRPSCHTLLHRRRLG